MRPGAELEFGSGAGMNDLRSVYDQRDGVQIVDCREPYEWQQIPSGLEDAFISLMDDGKS